MTNSYGLFICALIGTACCSLTTEYYQQLMSQEITKAATYQLPKNNEEFREGIESDGINGTIHDYGTFDVVIVGAGAAGCVLATRLSEIEDITVLLIEAGGEETDFSRIPGMWMHQQFSDRNWGYYSTPQKHCCLGMNNTQCIIPRGKLIGGSSSINAMMYVRGNRADYDNWAALGNRGWSYKDVLPYFKKSENSQIRGDRFYHGKGGFWNVEYAKPTSPIFANFIQGSLETNQTILDYNGRNQIGSSRLQFNTKRGKRQSLGTAFLDNARKRRNLKVVTKALVTKIVIDSRTKEAKGVQFVTRCKKFRVMARREVVISAGAINTPQLLMLSGIGPQDHLKEKKIPVIVDLPVGRNLIEHPTLILAVHTNYTSPNSSLEHLVDLYLQGLGILTKAEGADGIGFTITGTDPKRVPSIEILFAPPFGVNLDLLQRGVNYNNTVDETALRKISPRNDVLLWVLLLHEKSRGRVLLRTNSPLDFPDIDLNMFEEQEDVDVLSDGVRYVFGLLKTEAFRKINASLGEPGLCEGSRNDEKRYLECLIRTTASTIYHPCGTAAMGPDRKRFVVDDELKVHGVKKLRVADASIIPTPVSGHTSSVTVMVAEKAADIIKREFGKF